MLAACAPGKEHRKGPHSQLMMAKLHTASRKQPTASSHPGILPSGEKWVMQPHPIEALLLDKLSGDSS